MKTLFGQEGHASIVMEAADFRHSASCSPHSGFQLTNLTFTINRLVFITIKGEQQEMFKSTHLIDFAEVIPIGRQAVVCIAHFQLFNRYLLVHISTLYKNTRIGLYLCYR